MNEIILISLVALFGSLSTFFTGFGLGTILTPIFLIFFPLETAILLTAIVHFLNNVLKSGLLAKFTNWKIVFKFGFTAIIGSLIGAMLLHNLETSNYVVNFSLLAHNFETNLIKIVIAILMFLFALWELIPQLNKMQFSPKLIYLGGAISGFFGGLSGHQGALRSAFLMRMKLEKQEFIATGVLIAMMIDISRIGVYFQNFDLEIIKYNDILLLSAVVSAFLGALLGKKLIKKVNIQLINYLVASFLIIMSFCLGFGVI